METSDRKKIDANWQALIDHTNFAPIMDFMVKKNVFTTAEVRKMTGAEFSKKETAIKNVEFYTTIKKRGPEAFKHLLKGLHATDHPELAKKLDPTYRSRLVMDEEQHQLPRYEDDGPRVLLIDNTWNHEACKSDKETLASLFEQWGYRVYEFNLDNLNSITDHVKEEISSCVILRFSKYIDRAGGIYMDEESLIHDILKDKSLEEKAKILISLRYVFTQTDALPCNVPQTEQQPSAGHIYNNILWVRIYIDGIAGDGTGLSAVVQKFVDVCTTNHNLPFTKQLQRVEDRCDKKTVEVDNIYFPKEYYLVKQKK